MIKKPNIGIILGTTRVGRVSPQVGNWIKTFAEARGDATYKILDLKDYSLPFLGEEGNQEAIVKWNQDLLDCDGFIFVTAEYNHAIPAVLKNALDLAKDAWANKAAGLVSYGSMGGARAAEQLRLILGELQIADVRTQVLFSLFHDSNAAKEFTPLALHTKNANTMIDQLLAWTNALKTIRTKN